MARRGPSRRRLLALAAAGLGMLAGRARCAIAQPASPPGAAATAPSGPETVAYVANAGDPSIDVLSLDRRSGDVQLIAKTAIPGADRPSPDGVPLAVSPDRRFLYAALRSEPESVAAFAIDPASGTLGHLGNTPLDGGAASMTIDRTGKWLLCAADRAGKLTVNPIAADGRITAPPNQVLADHPQAQCVALGAANTHAWAAVPGQDAVLQFRFDPKAGTLSANSPDRIGLRTGLNAGRFALHPNGRFLYLLAGKTAAIGVFAIDPEAGTLKGLQSVEMMTPGFKGEVAAGEVHATPGGKFLFASERKTSTLVGYRVDADKGSLAPVGRTSTETDPRGFGIEPRGFFLLSLGLASNHMTVYRIRPTGVLEPVKQHAVGKQPSAVEIIDLKP